MPPSSPTPALTQAGLVSPAPSHTPNLAQSCCLTPDTEAGDDFLATGPGAKGQEGGAIPGCEVAGRRLAQALVGNLHGEEPQPSRLVWDPPKPGGRVRGYSAPWALPNHPPCQARPRSSPLAFSHPLPVQVGCAPCSLPLGVHIPAGLIAVRCGSQGGSILLPVQLGHQLIFLPHTALEVPAHSHQLVRNEGASTGG